MGTNQDPQSVQEMMGVIRSAKPGAQLELIFADKTFNGDLHGRVYMVLTMHDAGAIRFGEMPMMNLLAVASSGRWSGFRTYTITVLDAFDPEYFISRTIGREMLERVNVKTS